MIYTFEAEREMKHELEKLKAQRDALAGALRDLENEGTRTATFIRILNEADCLQDDEDLVHLGKQLHASVKKARAVLEALDETDPK